MPRLNQFSENIWVLDGDLVNFLGFPYPTRSVLVKLPSGDLWVWSPVALSGQLESELRGIGKVKHLVSPNKFHHLYLRDWSEAYPDALLWGPESTINKKRGLFFQEALKDKPPTFWEGSLEQYWMNGSFFVDEVVFFHRDSKTVIFADMAQNFSTDFLKKYWTWWQRKVALILGVVEPNGSAPLEVRLSWLRKQKDRAKLRRILDQIPENVIVAHGEIQKGTGLTYLKESFQWLLGTQY